MEEDLIGAMSCTHELKWNEIFKFACSGLCPLVAALCRLGERPVLAAVRHPIAGCRAHALIVY